MSDDDRQLCLDLPPDPCDESVLLLWDLLNELTARFEQVYAAPLRRAFAHRRHFGVDPERPWRRLDDH